MNWTSFRFYFYHKKMTIIYLAIFAIKAKKVNKYN